MSFSVVILSRTLSNLAFCVEAVRRNEPGLHPSDIVVVDDDEAGAIKAWCVGAGVRRVKGEKPFVFARNANIGLDKAIGLVEIDVTTHSDPAPRYTQYGHDAAILLNDDALLKTRLGFTSLYETWQQCPQYGILSAACNNVGNQNQLGRGAEYIRHEERMLCFVAVLISREAYLRVGPLDEQYSGYGFDDDDYSRRVLDAGYKLGVWDQCFVDHGSLRPTFRSLPSHAANFEHNRKLYEEKWQA